MEFSSIWYFSFSSLISLVFLTIGVYCLDKATISIPPNWFKHQIQALIASSVTSSISYAFLFRPPLEHQELDAAPKLVDFYSDLYPGLSRSILTASFSFYAFSLFHNKAINLILLILSLLLILHYLYSSLKYFKTNGNGNPLARIAGPFLLYPHHSLCWISFNVFMFFSLCANFEDKYTLFFPGGECLSIWGLHSYISWVLVSISILGSTLHMKSFLMAKSPILIYAYEQRQVFEIILGMIFVVFAQYFSGEKSLPLMFAFMSFAITWLGNIANVQPGTDLGIFHFFVSSSMECAVSLFGIHVYTFLVLCGCIVLEILRWKIESVSLRHTGIRESVFLDWVRSTTAGVALEEVVPPPEGKSIGIAEVSKMQIRGPS